MALCFPFWEIVLIFATSKTYSENTYMVIKTDKEYREYKEATNALPRIWHKQQLKTRTI